MVVSEHFAAELAALAASVDWSDPVGTTVDEVLRRAEGLGLEDEADIAVFAALLLCARQLGTQDAELLASLRSVLKFDDVNGPGKFFLIDDELRELAPSRPHAATLLQRIEAVRKAMH